MHVCLHCSLPQGIKLLVWGHGLDRPTHLLKHYAPWGWADLAQALVSTF